MNEIENIVYKKLWDALISVLKWKLFVPLKIYIREEKMFKTLMIELSTLGNDKTRSH